MPVEDRDPGQVSVAATLPYLAVGAGEPFVFLAGLLPYTGVESPTMRRIAVRTAEPFARTRRVLYFNRRQRLHLGITMAELAHEHAVAIEALGLGSLEVIGSPTGGSIAQQLAADHPGVVRRLVLLSTGCRLAPDAARLQRQVGTLIGRPAPRHRREHLGQELPDAPAPGGAGGRKGRTPMI